MAWIEIDTASMLQNGRSDRSRWATANWPFYRSDDQYFVTDNVCTHRYALLSDGYLEDGCIECPLHQARFDIRTGQAMCARPPPTSARTRSSSRTSWSGSSCDGTAYVTAGTHPHRRRRPGGAMAAAELRKLGHAERIVMVGGERHAPYERPPLSKAVLPTPASRARSACTRRLLCRTRHRPAPGRPR
ncbi:Rieske 2Fe-2S domain-containing protein [Cupriavidus basilensis]